MDNETTSFWTEIKRYEDILAKEPGSYCFAQLSELYRKLGLLDDAIAVAQKGIAVHPDYAGGYMALGKACFDKGLKKEARESLERVVRVTPENLMAQKLLGQIYFESGETKRATETLHVIISLDPSDTESRISLESLQRTSSQGSALLSEDVPVTEIPVYELVHHEIQADVAEDEVIDLEDAVILADEDIEPVEEVFDSACSEEDEPEEPAVDEDFTKDPITTSTLADLYIAQGFLKRALKVYRDLLDADPDNELLREKILKLKLRVDEDEQNARQNSLEAIGSEDIVFADRMQPQVTTAEPPVENPVGVVKGDVVSVLEGWLENIRGMRR
jgi:tetratricopeptide (TPR) repeat protein